MLIIPVKEGENIDRALKRFKRKFDRTGGMRQLRKRQQFQSHRLFVELRFKKQNTYKD